jgi:hypothetical protein
MKTIIVRTLEIGSAFIDLILGEGTNTHINHAQIRPAMPVVF